MKQMYRHQGLFSLYGQSGTQKERKTKFTSIEEKEYEEHISDVDM